MEVKKRDLSTILNFYSNKLSKKQQFYHILKEIRKHDSKLKKLKKKEDWKGHLKDEICDVFIHASALMQLEKVNQKILDKSSRHFADKVKEIYQK